MGSSGQEEEAPGIFRAWVEGASGNMALALTALVEQVQSWAKGVGLGGLLTLLPKMDTLGTLLVGWMVFVTLILMLGTFFYFKFIHTLGNETSSEQDDSGPGEEGQGKATKGKGGTGTAGSATAGKSKAAKKDEVARKPTIVPDHKPEPVSAPVGTGADPDAVKWTNNVFTWLYNSADGGQLVRKVWLETLNENTVKTAIDTGILVEVVELMKQTPAPVLSNMVVDCSPTDNVTITCDCDATLYLRIITTRTQGDQTTESEYACAVTPLRGRLNLAAVTAELLAVAKFDGWPEVSLKLEGIRNNSTGLNEQQMLDVIDEVLTSALRNSVLEFNFQPIMTFPRFRRARQAPDPIIPVGYDSMVREKQTHPPSAPRKTPKAEFVPLHDEKIEAAGESFTALTLSSNLTSSEEQLIARNLTKYPSLENAEMGPDEIEEFCKTWQENYVPAADVPPPKEEAPEPPLPAASPSTGDAAPQGEEGEPKTQSFVLMVSSRSKLIDEPRNAMVVEEDMDGMEEEEAELADVVLPRRPSDEPCLRKETGSPLLLAAPKYNSLAEPEEDDDLEDTKMRFDRLDILEKPQLVGSAGLGALLKGPFVSDACCVGVTVGVAAQVPQLDPRLETAALGGSVACDLPEYDQEAPTQPPLPPPLHNPPSSATPLCLEPGVGVGVGVSSGCQEPPSSPSPVHSLSPESLLPTASGVSNSVDGSGGENDVEERELLVSVGEGDACPCHQSSGVVVCAGLGSHSSPDRKHSEAVSEDEDEVSSRKITMQGQDVEYPSEEEDLGFESFPDKDLKAALSNSNFGSSHSEVTLHYQDIEYPFEKEELATDNLSNKNSEAVSKTKDQNICSGVTMQGQTVDYLSDEEDLGIHSLPEGKDPRDILEGKSQSLYSGVTVQDRNIEYLYEEDEGIASLNLSEVMARYEQIERDIALRDNSSLGSKTGYGSIPESKAHGRDTEGNGKEISAAPSEEKDDSKDINTVMKKEATAAATDDDEEEEEASIDAQDDDDDGDGGNVNTDTTVNENDDGVNKETSDEAEENGDGSEDISITPEEEEEEEEEYNDDEEEISTTLKADDEDENRETNWMVGDEDVREEAAPRQDTHIPTTPEEETEEEDNDESKRGKTCLREDENDEDESKRADMPPKGDDTDGDDKLTTTPERETEKQEDDEAKRSGMCLRENENDKDKIEAPDTAPKRDDTDGDDKLTTAPERETEKEGDDDEAQQSNVRLNHDEEDEEERETADILPKRDDTDEDDKITTTPETETEKEYEGEANRSKMHLNNVEDESEEGSTASKEEYIEEGILIPINTEKKAEEGADDVEPKHSEACLSCDEEVEDERETAETAPKTDDTDKDIQVNTTTATATATAAARSDTATQGTEPAKEEEHKKESKQNKICLNEFTESLFRHIEIEDSELSIPEECVEILPWEVMDVYVPQEERQQDPETSPKASWKKGTSESDDNLEQPESPSPSLSPPEHERKGVDSEDDLKALDSPSPLEEGSPSSPSGLERETGDTDDEPMNDESPVSSPLKHEKERSYSDNGLEEPDPTSPPPSVSSPSSSTPECEKGSRDSDEAVKNLASPSVPQEASPSSTPLQEGELPTPSPPEEARSSPLTPQGQDSLPSSSPHQEQHSPSLSPPGKVTDGEALGEFDDEVPPLSSSLQGQDSSPLSLPWKVTDGEALGEFDDEVPPPSSSSLQEQYSSPSLSLPGKVTEGELDEEPEPDEIYEGPGFTGGGELVSEEQHGRTEPNVLDCKTESYMCSEENDNYVSDYLHEHQGKDGGEVTQGSDPPARQDEEEDTQDIEQSRNLQLGFHEPHSGEKNLQNLEEDMQDTGSEEKPKDLHIDIQDVPPGEGKPKSCGEDMQDPGSEEGKSKILGEEIQDVYSEGKSEDREDFDERWRATATEATNNVSLMHDHCEPSSVVLDENGNGVCVDLEAEGDAVAAAAPDLEGEESECVAVLTDKAELEENGSIVVAETEDIKKSNGVSIEAESNGDRTDPELDSNIIKSDAECDEPVSPVADVPNKKISTGFDRDAYIVSTEFKKDSNIGSTEVEVPYKYSNGSSVRTEFNGDGVSTKTEPYKDINVGSTKVEVPDEDNSEISTEGATRNGVNTDLNKDIETASTEKEPRGEETNGVSPEMEWGAVQYKTDIEENTNKPLEAGFYEDSNKSDMNMQLVKDSSGVSPKAEHSEVQSRFGTDRNTNRPTEAGINKESDKSEINTQLKDTNMIASETDGIVQANGRARTEETQDHAHTPNKHTLACEEQDEDAVDNARITELRRQHQLGAFIPSDSEVEMRTSVSSLESLNAQLQEALKNKYYASLRYPSYFSGEESTTDANTDDEYFDPRTLTRDPFSPEEKDFRLSGRDEDEDELGYSSHGTYSAQDSSTDSEVEEIIGVSSEAGVGGLYSKDEWRMSDISLIAEVETIDDGSFESRENQATPTPLQDGYVTSSHETVKHTTHDTTSNIAPTSTLYKVVNASQEGGPALHQDSRQPSLHLDGDKSCKHTVGNSSRENGQEKRVSFGGEVIVESEDIQTQEQSGTLIGHSDSERKGKLLDVSGRGEQGTILTTSPQSVAPLIPTDSAGALTQPQVASRTGKLASGGAAAPDHTPSASGLPQWTKALPSYPVYGTYFVATTPHSTTTQPMGIPGLNGKRLLVKIVKATGVGCEKPVSEAYSVVEMDEPPQKFTTSVVKDTSSPFWDEQFLFDLSGGTLELLFELYDKTNGNFLGLGIVGIEELVATPSQRQIIPLQSRPYENDEVSGSLTVEFLFLDRADLPDHTLRASTTSQSVTPKGDLVTTTTTTYIKAPENQDVVVNGGDSVAAVVLRDIEEKKAVVTNNASKSTMIIHASKKPDFDEQHGYMTDELLNLMTATTTTATPTITTTGAHTTVTTSTTTATHSAPVTTTADASEPAENEERGRSRGNRRKRDSFFGTLKKRFSRSKVRSKSMDPGQRDPSLERDPSIGRSVSMERSSALNRASGLLSVPPGAGGDAGSTRSSLSDASAISSSSTRTYVNEASTLIVETSENGVFKHYLIPLSLQQKSKWRKKGLKLHIFGEHTFVAKHMSSSTQCEVCQKSLGRRFGKQGYVCRDCGYKCHKPCHVKTETTCPKSTVNNMDLEYVRDPKEERRAWLKKTNKTA